MIQTNTPYTLKPLGTALIAATQATGSATLITPTSTQFGSVGSNVMVYNAGPNAAFVKFGPAGTVATVPTTAGTGSTPVPVGFFGLVLARDATTDTTASAICNTGETATVYFTVGNGT